MSLNGVITSLGSVTLQVTRTAQGTRTNGRYTPGAQTTFDVVCGVPEPVTGRELHDVPEGRRGDEVLKLFLATDLVAERPGIDPDVVRYLGADADMLTSPKKSAGRNAQLICLQFGDQSIRILAEDFRKTNAGIFKHLALKRASNAAKRIDDHRAI